ncbi:MAG: right-handed parallel beta-helix repeat-containing protein [Ignavibacteriales bacterium]|nr:right-handed parallel beta-helix repeat-containing protein [Ignavibacteriales bacterium]
MKNLATALVLFLLSSSFAAAQILTVDTHTEGVDPADGKLSLREAIDSAKVLAGANEIRFDAVHFHPDFQRVIELDSSLVIDDPATLVIDGGTQVVILKPNSLTEDRFNGLVIRSPNVTVKNLILSDMRGAAIVVDTVAASQVVIGPKNSIINTEENGIWIIKSSDVTITENTVSQSGWWGYSDGILITDTSANITIEKNVVMWSYSSGIASFQSDYLTIRQNYVGRNMYVGIRIYGGGGYNVIEENIVVGNSWDGVSLYGGEYSAIRGNSIGDSTRVVTVPTLATATAQVELIPLRVPTDESPVLERERKLRAEFDARRQHIKPERKSLPRTRELPPPEPRQKKQSVTAGTAATMDHVGNFGNGITLYGTSYTTIEDNLIYASWYDGIFMDYWYPDDINPEYPSYITIRRNRIERSGDSHVEFYQTGPVTIRENSMIISQYGIYGGAYGGGYYYEYGASGPASVKSTAVVEYPAVITIAENYMTQGDDGEAVYLYGVDSVHVERNIINNYYYGGVYVYDAGSAVIRMNDLSNIDYTAMDVYVTRGLWINDNKVQNSYEGLYASGTYEGGSFADILRNHFISVTYDCFEVYGFEHANIHDNVIDGVYYTGMDIGYMTSAHIARNSVLRNSYEGLYVYSVDSLVVENNIFRGQYDDNGMYVYSCLKAYITGNTVAEGYDGSTFYYIDSLWVWKNSFLTSRSSGLEINYSTFAHVWENDIYGHQYGGAYFSYVDSLNFEKNNVTGNLSEGITSYYSNPLIRNNTILENGDAGIYSYSDTVIAIVDNFIALNEAGFNMWYTTTDSRVTGNTFFRNQDGSTYYGTIPALNAENNYWGHASGPRDVADTDGLGLMNPDGSGDHVSEQIDWQPFLTAPTYLSEARPAIAQITPGESPRSGGMTAALRGRQFLPGAIVVLGKDTLENTNYVSSDLIAFTVPPGRGGPVHVIVYNANGKADTLFKGFRYENNSPYPFALVSPALNATIGTSSPRFIWRRSVDPDGDAVEYILHYSSSATFETFTAVEAIPDTSYLTPANTLSPNTTYYWRVVASDTREGFATSDVHTFSTGLVLSVENPEALPTTYAIHQNFPNPFNPETTIRYQVPEATTVSLKVFDLLGREVATLVNDEKTAGFYTVTWSGRNLTGQQVASGVYFFRIEAGTFVETRRMLLVR